MRSSRPLRFFRLALPLPLDADQAARAVERLATLPRAARLVLETRADAGETSFFFGCAVQDIAAVRRTLAAVIPEARMTRADDDDRGPLQSAVTVNFRPVGAPLAGDLALVTLSVFAGMHRARGGAAAAVVQLVFDTVDRPAGAGATGTLEWIARALLAPAAPAARPPSRTVRDEPRRIRAFLRLGVAGDEPDERRRRGREIESAYRHALAPSGHLYVRRLRSGALTTGRTSPWHGSPLTPAELAVVAAWPLGDQALPGIPDRHPRRVMPSRATERRARLFGEAAGGGPARPVGLATTDAMSHLLAIGPTGSGKTTTLARLALADIEAGRGVVVIDPKAAMPTYLAARLPAARRDDVIWIDPADPAPVGFNPLDATGRDPDVVADAVLSVFAKTFRESWGPRTADIFSASLRTLTRGRAAGDPAATLADLPRLWSDVRYRQSLLAHLPVDDLGLMSFWSAYDGLAPAAQAAWIASPMNKLRSVLLRPAAMRVICQPAPRFALRDVFRERRIVLLSLNEGLIGPQTAELIGGLVVAELWQATEERVREDGAADRPALVYLDEADRFMATPAISLADALARSRSLHVGWCLAVQHWDALPVPMRAAIKSNARNKLVWRLESDEDARLFARLSGTLAPEDFQTLPRFHVYASLLARGEPQPWALVRTLGPTAKTADAAALKRRSARRWGAAPGLPPQPDSAPPLTAPSPAAAASAAPPSPPGRARRRSP